MPDERRIKFPEGTGLLSGDSSRAQRWFVLAVEVVGKPTAVMTYFLILFYMFLVSTDFVESFVDGRPRSSTKFCNIMAAFMFAAMTLFLITVVENWTPRRHDRPNRSQQQETTSAEGDGCFITTEN
ncbi:unnamed protein product [Candidula unifasciata]|uniref:Uncharacterized protein n=1 Tax=Candidula unifasciata TaxID=100452 RepID=A0A8S3YMK2_9EUPU|nr:unnamed protein product [Candidula unifasciata]